MAKYYKMVITSTYEREVIVKANSLEEAKAKEDEVIDRIDLLDSEPEVNAVTYERDDYGEDDVEFDFTFGGKGDK